jgi:hypothetical protein
VGEIVVHLKDWVVSSGISVSLILLLLLLLRGHVARLRLGIGSEWGGEEVHLLGK